MVEFLLLQLLIKMYFDLRKVFDVSTTFDTRECVRIDFLLDFEELILILTEITKT